MRLLVHPNTASQVVSVELLFDYSSADEPAYSTGLRRVLLCAMLQGSRASSGDEIQHTLNAVGGTLEGRILPTAVEFTLTIPADALPTGLAALSEVVCRPLLSDESIQSGLEQAQRALQMPATGAVENASRITHALIFFNHPFAGDGNGTPLSLITITPDAVRRGYQSHLVPNTAVMAVAGRCDVAIVRKLLGEDFAGWKAHDRTLRPPVPMPALTDSKLTLREAPGTAACVMLSFPVCGAEHPDNLPLRLLDTVLSSGTGSRLFRIVREQRHLAYEVATIFPAQAACGQFSLYALTGSATLEETRTALITELARLQTQPIGEDELRRAQALLKGRYLLSHQYSAQYAFDLAWYELLGLGSADDQTLAAAIDAITPQQLQRVARTYFTHYHLVVIVPQTNAAAEK